ncbi:MAG: hypothetical protein HKO83_13405 [Ignavibacteriaceae bacterium]|nr:hypothetical protein [Ignavibacteria bacterium]MBT8390269.1 hypothetical protein [Ignavibacteria bacterium]NNL22310.1 hypothetical protein [Ignavibacteriaceae bacterium]
MKLDTLMEDAKKNKYVILSASELEALLSNSEVLKEEETLISDKIRLLNFKDELLIQEKTDNDEFLIRLIKSEKEAENFIQNRLEIYEKMWDGCGCKVEYY